MLRSAISHALVILLSIGACHWRDLQIAGRNATTIDRLHLFLPITEVTLDDPDRASWFCKSLLSALVNDYDPILYNWDAAISGKGSHKLKVFGLLEQLRNERHGIRAEDVVVMADSLDVWFQLPPADLVRRYRAYGKPVIVGAELRCWPNGMESSVCRAAPLSDLPPDLFEDARTDGLIDAIDAQRLPRHANSGFVVGTQAGMTAFYEDVAAILKDPSYPYRQSDQGAFNIALAQGKVAVDHHLSLVWNSANDADALLYINHARHPDGRDTTTSKSSSTIPWHLYPALGRHLWTGETPVALHHNGPIAKNELDDLWTEIWYGSDKRGFQEIVRRSVRGKTVRAVGSTGAITRIAASDLCADHLPVFADKAQHV